MALIYSYFLLDEHRRLIPLAPASLSVEEGDQMPEYIRKDKLVEAIQHCIDIREKKTCQRQLQMEAGAFRYVLAIINKIESIELQDGNSDQ